MRTIPVDSTDARELRELEQDLDDAERAEQARHAAQCRGGWLGEDTEGRPIPCGVCRPHLGHVACRTCSAPWQSCQSLTRIRRGPCCDTCDHRPHQGGGNPSNTCSNRDRGGGASQFPDLKIPGAGALG